MFNDNDDADFVKLVQRKATCGILNLEGKCDDMIKMFALLLRFYIPIKSFPFLPQLASQTWFDCHVCNKRCFKNNE